MKTTVVISFLLLGLLNISHAQTKEEIEAAKKAEKLKLKYVFWEDCYLIRLNGDTVFGKLKPFNHDLSASYGVTEIKEPHRLLHANGTEEKIPYGKFKEVYLYNGREGYKLFVTYPNSVEARILRVVVEGNCRLLHREIIVQNIGTSTSASFAAPYKANNRHTVTTADKDDRNQYYYLYYKNELTRVKLTNEPFIIGEQFRKKHSELLSDCPALATQVANNTFHTSDLREVVKEFNECIAK